MLKRIVTLKEFYSIERLLSTLRTLGVVSDHIVTWEKKPKIIINSLGDFEFEKPEETYGCVITFVNFEEFKEIYKIRFMIVED